MRLNYFNFKEFNKGFLLTNDFGNYAFVSKKDFKKILQRDIDLKTELGIQLLEKNFVYEDTNIEFSERLKDDIRRQKGYEMLGTSLHIFVVTTACNMRCVYCQANNGVTDSSVYMTESISEKAVDIALQSPAHFLSFEFQGGEPLLNFPIIMHIVEYAEQHKGCHEIEYNLVSNLTLITEEMLDYFVKYNFNISTSLDGPEILHNSNRPFGNGSGSYKKLIDSIQKIRERGLHVGAIQTTTKLSLNYAKEIVQEYSRLGFDALFLRPLTPLGKATLNWDKIGYAPEDFVLFYSKALAEIIKINQEGIFFKEQHASIFLSKIYGKFVNYMELRSPCGACVGQLAYYADGNIFTCDEGRMLYEMGDHTFKLGNVFENSYADIIRGGVCKTVCASSILETIPACCDCVYQPYCGTCPVINYAKNHDIIEKEPRGFRCKIYSGMLDYLFGQIINGNKDIDAIFKSWCN